MNMTTLFEVFEDTAARFPQNIALLDENRFALNYSELLDVVNATANRIKTNSPILAIYCGRCLEHVVSLLTASKLGLPFLPLDISCPLERVAKILNETGTRLVVTTQREQHQLESIRDKIEICVISVHSEHHSAVLNGTNETKITNNACSRFKEIAYLIYTSGSTADPKCIAVSNKSIISTTQAQIEQLGFTSDETVLWLASPMFDASIADMLEPLFTGSKLVVVSLPKLCPGRPLAKTLDKFGVTCLTACPSVLASLVDEQFQRLHILISAGEKLMSNLALRLLSKAEKFYNVYGLTETAVAAIFFGPIRERHLKSTKIVPIGTAFKGSRIVVEFGPKNGESPHQGEIIICGDCVDGNFNILASNDHKPTGESCYHTKDVGYLDVNGDVVCLGRMDTKIKLRGFLVDRSEVEEAISRVAGSDACFVNKSGDALTAYVKPDRDIQPDIIRLQLLNMLPDYMVPGRWRELKVVPLTQNGKFDPEALENCSVPFSNRDQNSGFHFEDTTCGVAESFRNVLNLETEELTDYSDFFHLGGSSFDIAFLLSCIEEKLKVELPAHVIFTKRTIGAISEHIDLISDQIRPNKGEEMPVPDLLAEVATLRLKFQAFHPHTFGTSQSGISSDIVSKTSAVLITGASGFLGAALLESLVDQGKLDKIIVTQRNRNVITTPKLAQAEMEGLIEVITADLEKPNLGISLIDWDKLASEVDVIIHCAADVNYLKSYVQLKPANVDSVFDLCVLSLTQRPKRLIFASSLLASSFGPCWLRERCISEEMTNEQMLKYQEFAEHDIGYAQAKWVVETFLSTCENVNWCIARFGLIAFSEVEQVLPANHFISLLLMEPVRLLCYPCMDGIREFMVTRETAAEVLAALVSTPHARGVFNVAPENDHSILNIYESMNTFMHDRMTPKPLTEFLALVKYQGVKSSLFAFLPFMAAVRFEQKTILDLYAKTPPCENRNTTELLGRTIEPIAMEKIVNCIFKNCGQSNELQY